MLQLVLAEIRKRSWRVNTLQALADEALALIQRNAPQRCVD